MMRKIKFRAWDSSQNYMAYQETPDLETLSSFMHHFSDADLMQSTTLFDKNNKEIYEGDLVEWSGKISGGEFIHKCVVIFDSLEWNGWALENLEHHELGTVPIGMHGADILELEVTGNIKEIDKATQRELLIKIMQDDERNGIYDYEKINWPTKVIHSNSKPQFNVVNTRLGSKFKLASVPYISFDAESDKEIAFNDADFISRCFNNKEYILKNILKK